ncbi:MAG: toxin-antitoxin system YwqK family antitoxin [Candidatus Omnitrophica bacterium]|nr:toxin-antitoxin system YwqK family antitoxin [Candidatus Omnitrophota bacterium]
MSQIKIIEPYSWLDGQLQYNPGRANEFGLQVGEAKGFYPDGALKFSYPLLSGKLHGACRIWYQNGVLKREEIYENGELHGLAREWFPNGKIESEQHYKRGKRDGLHRYYYQTGQLAAERIFKDDRQHGQERRWHSNGKLSSQCSYVNGLRHGAYIEFSEDGKIIVKKYYIRGVVITQRLQRLLASKELTAETIVRIRNTALRRILLEEFGYERFLQQMNHEVIEKEGEQELIKINWHRREEPIYLVKVRCATTGVFYTLRVPPTMQTVKEAIAWTFGMKKEEYNPDTET